MFSELYWYSTCKRGEPHLLLQTKGCVQVADLPVQLEQAQEFYNYCILCKIHYSLTILFLCVFFLILVEEHNQIYSEGSQGLNSIIALFQGSKQSLRQRNENNPLKNLSIQVVLSLFAPSAAAFG